MSEIKMEAIPMEDTPGAVPMNELVPFSGCMCFVTSCFTTMPDCIGCQGKGVCLCCYSEFLACKLPKQGEDVWLHYQKGYTYCAPIKTLCMRRAQCFCMDIRCSIPFSDEIPQLITCCFFTCFFKGKPGPFQFMKSVSELESASA
eukprot:CAMPEP_0174967152 /NCGR_PEP_ID=MMETSP0004_2-20121128/7426_1 /TAXON_ID=420556 /ORGANISM="Ochromonas sp., Strain CCMP1393" /LENGTH=144 /DNA_ID=CAMNT_0016216255 /DNA_START=56 /DNA_END=490 /DNA_ORIENTATION=-